MIMKTLVNLLLFCSTILPLSNKPISKASSSFDGRAYDSSLMMDFTDSTQEEINSYYTSALNSSLTGDEFKKVVYDIISADNYFVDYGSGDKGVNQWYKITDRNWELSREISPETYKFSDDNKDNFYLSLLYFEDNTSKEKAINNYVNGFKVDKSTTKVDFEKETRPNNYIQEDKEHIWDKSNGFNESGGSPTKGAGTDLHHLLAADHNTNSAGHNSLDFGEVADKSASKVIYCYYADGSKDISGYRGESKLGQEVFEPSDKYKGDIARAIFYMATRYGIDKGENNSKAEPYLHFSDDLNEVEDISNWTGVFHNLDTLLEWNQIDPVSDYEKHRNNLIYKNVQRNRNPFIDFPLWANRIFAPDTLTVSFDNVKSEYFTHVGDKLNLDIYIPDASKFNIEIENNDNNISVSEDKLTLSINKASSSPIKVNLTYNDNGETISKSTSINIKDSLIVNNIDSIPNKLELNINDTYSLENLSLVNNYPNEKIILKSSDENLLKVENLTLKAVESGKLTLSIYVQTDLGNKLVKEVEVEINSKVETFLDWFINKFNSDSTFKWIVIGVVCFAIFLIVLIVVLLIRHKKIKKSTVKKISKKIKKSKKK